MAASFSRHSLENVFVPSIIGSADPSALPHEIAIVAADSLPTSGDWKSATWNATEEAAALLVRMSTDAPVGGSVTLSPGGWDVYWRASAGSEYPARKSGRISVT